ncbi:MAG TPA: ATP-binding protein [Bacteroidales bacterium]|nr:ATP-binding protein [Bacteroidales bacterium]
MYKKISIGSKTTNLSLVEKVIDEVTNEIGISKDYYGKILVSTMEGVNNAITHGNKLVPEKIVDIEIRFRNNELKIKISDQGSGFKPGDVPDPTTPENIEEINGRGVFLMSRLADQIKYNKKGNTVIMTFKNIID